MKKILLVVLLFVLSGCSFGQIEDTNGDEDFSIQTISEDEIIKGTNSVSVGRITTSKNNNYSMKVEKFSGVETICTWEKYSSLFNLTTDITINSGNFMLVLTTDKDVIKVFKNNEIDEFLVNTLSGDIHLKIVGESANFQLKYNS